MLTALAVLTLVLPNYTLTVGHGNFSPAQLAFVSVLSVLLYGSFVYAQMGSHREDFIEELADAEDGKHIAREGGIAANVAMLFIGLAGIVLLARGHSRGRRGRAGRA